MLLLAHVLLLALLCSSHRGVQAFALAGPRHSCLSAAASKSARLQRPQHVEPLAGQKKRALDEVAGEGLTKEARRALVSPESDHLRSAHQALPALLCIAQLRMVCALA
jgi:hypothetical protein